MWFPNAAKSSNVIESTFPKQLFILKLKWSDEATKIVQLESVGNNDEDCCYKGSYIEDSER